MKLGKLGQIGLSAVINRIARSTAIIAGSTRKIAAFAVSLSLMTSQAIAAPNCHANACTDVLITTFYVDTAGTLFIAVGGPMINLGCTLYGGVYVLLPKTATSSEMYSFLLSAMAQNRPITVRINNGTNPCTIQYVTWNG